jgi:hypothetical protein
MKTSTVYLLEGKLYIHLFYYYLILAENSITFYYKVNKLRNVIFTFSCAVLQSIALFNTVTIMWSGYRRGLDW